VSVCDDPSKLLDQTLTTHEIRAVTEGSITELDTHLIGTTIAMIGGGRVRAEDSIDHAVGFSNEVSVGQRVAVNDVLGMLYCRDAGGDEACRLLNSAYRMGKTSPNIELIPRIVS
jgi:thymidine phosphorylase